MDDKELNAAIEFHQNIVNALMSDIQSINTERERIEMQIQIAKKDIVICEKTKKIKELEFKLKKNKPKDLNKILKKAHAYILTINFLDEELTSYNIKINDLKLEKTNGILTVDIFDANQEDERKLKSWINRALDPQTGESKFIKCDATLKAVDTNGVAIQTMCLHGCCPLSIEMGNNIEMEIYLDYTEIIY